MFEFFRTWVLPELLSTGAFVLALVFMAAVLKPRQSPAAATAWLLVIFLLPYLGVPLFLMFGGRKMRNIVKKKHRLYSKRPGVPTASEGGGIERILDTYGVPHRSAGNLVRLAGDGVDAFQDVCRLIDEAEREIHVLSYILGVDDVGREIVARLAKRAGQGIKVRLLLDAMGSWRVKRSFVAPLVEAGGEVAYFMPVIHLPLRGRANLRNHRKILVIDGRVAMLGGMNLATEYMGPTPDPLRWVDLSVVVEGPVVQPIDELFRNDWQFVTGKRIEPIPSRPNEQGSMLSEGGTRTEAQVVASGPDVEGDPLYDSLISAIHNAERRLWIVTPYFVPDDTLARALELSARRGVDVRLIVPERSNHLMADIARESYLKQVQAAGTQVLLYAPVMVHAKVLVIDDSLAVVGSANMDMRSLFLNYEVALYLSTPSMVESTAEWVSSLFPACRTVIPKDGRVRELAEGVVRLLSPLL